MMQSRDDDKFGANRPEVEESFHYLSRAIGPNRAVADIAWRLPHPVAFFAMPREFRGLDNRILVVCSRSQERDIRSYLDHGDFHITSENGFRRLNKEKLVALLRDQGVVAEDEKQPLPHEVSRIRFVQDVSHFWGAAFGVGELHNIAPAQFTLPGAIVTSCQAHFIQMVHGAAAYLQELEVAVAVQDGESEEERALRICEEAKVPGRRLFQSSVADYPERFNCGPQLREVCRKFGIRYYEPFEGENLFEARTDPLGILGEKRSEEG